MRRSTLILLVLIAVTTGAILGGAHWLLRTRQGFDWAVGRLGALQKVRIGVEGAEGLLGEEWRIARMTISAERVDIVIRGAHARMRPLQWLPLTAVTESLEIDDITVRIKPRRTAPSGEPLRFLPRFLRVVVPGLRIGAAHVTLQNGVVLEARPLRADVHLASGSLVVGDADVDLREARVQGRYLLLATAPLSMEFALGWRTHSTLPVTGRTAGLGTLRELRTRTNVTAPLRAGIHMTLRDLDREFHWTATGLIAELDTRRFSPSSVVGSWHGTLRGTGQQTGAALRGELTSTVIEGRTLRYEAIGRHANHGLDFSRLAFDLAAPATHVEGSGRLDWTPALAYRFNGRVTGARWPLSGSAAVTVPAAGFQVRGWTAFDYTVGGTVEIPGLPAITGGGSGRYDGSRIGVSAGRAQLMDGVATFSGEMGFGPADPWQLDLDVQDVDPVALLPSLSGRLSFGLAASGASPGIAGDFDAAFRGLRGVLAGYPVDGHANLFRSQGQLGCRDCRITVAGATLEADGRADAAGGLAVRAVAPDLSRLAAGIAGKAHATLHAAPARTPDAGWRNLRIEGEFAVEDFAAHGLRAARVSGNADLDLSDRSSSWLRLRGVGLGVGERQVSSLRLSLDGVSREHSVELRVGVGDDAVMLAGSGALVADRYDLGIRELTTDGPRVPAYRLEEPARLSASRRESRLDRVCFRGAGAARICGEGRFGTPTEWSASFDAVGLPLRVLAGTLPGKPGYSGTFEVHGSAVANGGPWNGELLARVQDGELNYRRASGRTEVLELGDIEARATASPASFDATLRTRATDRTELAAAARIDRSEGDAASGRLSGAVHLVTNDLGLVPLFVPDIDRAAGRLEAALQLGGTPGAPEIGGRVTLADGSIDFYRTNLRLREVAARVSISANALDIDARARAGKGQAAVTGHLAWTAGALGGSVHLTGDSLPIVDLPEARIFASPDLRLAIDGQRIDVDGTVVVPFARVEPVEIKGAVLTSSDERLVGGQAEAAATPYQLYANVRLKLGDDVKLAALGLSGRLTGSVAAHLDPEDVGTGTGELVIEDGKYKAYSRELTVERGRLVFAGGALADPGVDMKASRDVPGYKVGVYVRGRLRRPELSFWSEPMLPQSQIASLLIVGRTLDSLQGADRQTLGTSRTQLLAQGGAVLAGQLGRYVGLDEVSVEQDSAEATSLVIGKFLSPRLYVSYGVSLTEKLNTFKLRYTIGDRWVIKTETGRESAVDVEYAIDR